MVLKMSKDKNLIMTVPSITYKDEHNAEKIKIIMPNQIEGKDSKLYSIWLCFINEKKLGKAINVTEFLADHSPSSYFIEFPMDNIFTYVAGTVKIWLKLLDEQTGMVDYTNYVTKHICTHPNEELEGEITEQEHSILESLMSKLDATSIRLGEVTAKVEDIISGEEQIVQPMLISPTHYGIEEQTD